MLKFYVEIANGFNRWEAIYYHKPDPAVETAGYDRNRKTKLNMRNLI